jgi:hypothetical protein
LGEQASSLKEVALQYFTATIRFGAAFTSSSAIATATEGLTSVAGLLNAASTDCA